MNMITDSDVDTLLAYLDDRLSALETRAVQQRLLEDEPFKRLLIELAREESQLFEWAFSKKNPATSDERPAEADRVQPASDVSNNTSAETRRTWFSMSQHINVGIVVALCFVLAPPVAIAIAAVRFGDFGLALPGWAASVNTLVARSGALLASAQGMLWLAGLRFGWFAFPRLCAVGSLASLISAITMCQVSVSNYAESEKLRREELIQNHQWVTYDSAFYFPGDIAEVIGQDPLAPTRSQIRQELKLLRETGFDGLVIHECRDDQRPIPELARELGFSAVIQGIRIADPQRLDAADTQQQINNAIGVAKFVDAYFLGELSAREVDFAALKAQLARLRRETGRPVTTSFVHDDYIGRRGDRLRALEDFTIRALARPWQGDSASPQAAAGAVRDALETFRDDDVPSLLHTVVYPSGGGDGFSEENQELFFREVMKLRIPRGVNIVYFNSFDRPWAKMLSERTEYTPKFEGFTGLFSVELDETRTQADYTAKRAAGLFKQRSD